MSSSAAVGDSPVTVTRIPRPEEPVPAVAWPTMGLLIAGLALWGSSTALFLTGAWPWPLTVVFNAVASYLLFTVAHDAGHNAAAGRRWLNETMGRLSTPLFAPHAAFRTWRYIHMQHHRNTNHDDGSDPDHFTMRGPAWQKPLRWMFIDWWYLVFYLPKLRSRPRAEQVEEIVMISAFIGICVATVATGHGWELLVCLLLPCRVAILWLAYAFDYLPHHGLHHKPSEDKLKTTRNRVGSERWVSPMMLYQNYHLVHHLHPVVPFYRYIDVWRRNEDQYLDGDPALSTVRGRELTTEEYRRIRELADHH